LKFLKVEKCRSTRFVGHSAFNFKSHSTPTEQSYLKDMFTYIHTYVHVFMSYLQHRLICCTYVCMYDNNGSLHNKLYMCPGSVV
jgi:hypothetical protein